MIRIGRFFGAGAVAYRHRPAARGEVQRDAAANTPGAARDERDFWVGRVHRGSL